MFHNKNSVKIMKNTSCPLIHLQSRTPIYIGLIPVNKKRRKHKTNKNPWNKKFHVQNRNFIQLTISHSTSLKVVWKLMFQTYSFFASLTTSDQKYQSKLHSRWHEKDTDNYELILKEWQRTNTSQTFWILIKNGQNAKTIKKTELECLKFIGCSKMKSDNSFCAALKNIYYF